MKLCELSPAVGSTKAPKRVGRGHASGTGKTAGKGVFEGDRRNPYAGYFDVALLRSIWKI